MQQRTIETVYPWRASNDAYAVQLRCGHIINLAGVGPALQAPQPGFDVPCPACPDLPTKEQQP